MNQCSAGGLVKIRPDIYSGNVSPVTSTTPIYNEAKLSYLSKQTLVGDNGIILLAGNHALMSVANGGFEIWGDHNVMRGCIKCIYKI